MQITTEENNNLSIKIVDCDNNIYIRNLPKIKGILVF